MHKNIKYSLKIHIYYCHILAELKFLVPINLIIRIRSILKGKIVSNILKSTMNTLIQLLHLID